MNSVPKEYANVRRFYTTKYGEKKGVEMFEAYMRRRHQTSKNSTKNNVVSRSFRGFPCAPCTTKR